MCNIENYNSGEHVISADGDNVIKYSGIDININGKKVKSAEYYFTLSNGVKVTFGEIVALAGDLFGTDKPISDGKTFNEMKERFMEQFNTLDKSDGTENKWSQQFGQSAQQIPVIKKLFKMEINRINNAIKNNELPSKAYEDVGENDNVDYNVATGGGSKIVGNISKVIPFLKIVNILPAGRYISLAELNWDHFAKDGRAWNAYLVGHTIAMDLAAKAGKNNNVKMLEKAYTIDAFANHFLTDYFSSGHLRTPRKELQFGPKGIFWFSRGGGYLSKLMHDEDCSKGLWVKNNGSYNNIKLSSSYSSSSSSSNQNYKIIEIISIIFIIFCSILIIYIF